MGQHQTSSADGAVHSYLSWWVLAGVDTVVSDLPYVWLGEATPKDAPVAASIPTETKLASYADVINHLMTFDFADTGPPQRRIAPSGDPSSDLMILVDFPDSADVEEGVLLSDPIFDKMLQALDRTRDTVYVAALSPGRPITGRLSVEAVETFGRIAKQHIGFIAPKRLWLVGNAASRAILGVDDAAARGNLHHVNHGGTNVDVIATAHPRMFDGSKSRKAAAWAEMQRLIVRDDA